MKLIQEIKEVIKETEILILYNNVEESFKIDAGSYGIACNKFTDSLKWMFEVIGDLITEELGIDDEGYYKDDFEYTTGSGQISSYFNLDYGSDSFEIRVSDHDDKHFNGYRRLVDVTANNFEDNLINIFKEEINKI